MTACGYCGRWLPEPTTCPYCGHPNQPGTGPPPAPAGARPVGTLAGFWRRALALVLDALLIAIVTGSLFRARLDIGTTRQVGIDFGLGPSSLVALVYDWLMIALVRGQTVGKMALRIRITTPEGGPVDLVRSAVRAGMAIVSGLALGLGYLWAAWDPEKRTWHDMVAGTRAYLAAPR